MRDPNRIEPVMHAVRILWKTMPDKTLFELFADIQIQKKHDCFYMEDDALVSLVEEICQSFHDMCEAELSAEQIEALNLLADIWKRYPDWRLMQLVCNLQRIFGSNPTDAQFVECLKKEGTQ